MAGIILLLLIPVAVSVGSFLYFERRITPKELILQLAIVVAAGFGGWHAMRWSGMQSTEHWNGRITTKDSGREGCCHCWTVCDSRDSEGNCTSSHEECSHNSDYWWRLKVSTGDEIRHGCEGANTPPAWWSTATPGDAASIAHSYTNYLKADPNSILHHDADPTDIKGVPAFPEIEGKYKVKKVVVHGGARAPRSWQRDLMEINANLGMRVQQCQDAGGQNCGRFGVDITVVLTTRSDPEWAYAVEAAWLYGPKNGLIVVMGTDGSKIIWARVVTISDVEELAITLRDVLPGRALDDPELIEDVGRHVAGHFSRKPMSDFDYLMAAAAPKGWRLAALHLLMLALSIGLTIFMHRQDVFGDERLSRLYRRRHLHRY